MNKLKISIILLLVLAVANIGGKQINLPKEYEGLKNQAEKLYSEGSYSLSNELYLKAESTKVYMELPSIEKRWVDFRIADTLWRSESATKTHDSTKYDIAYKKLEGLVRDIQKDEEKDIVFTEVHESLGDFFWLRKDTRNWNEAWKHYNIVLDWLAGSSDLELASERYIKIVWEITEYNMHEGYYQELLPLSILENVLKISKTENDKSRSHYLIAMYLRYRGEQNERVSEEFKEAIKPGKFVDWYDDALYHYAEWLANYGSMIQLENGGLKHEQNYIKALEFFRRILSEFEKGETKYYDSAKQQIENIKKPVINVSVSNIFLPDSEIEFHLNWRNVKRIDFSLYKVDITKDVKFPDTDTNIYNWVQYVDISLSEKIKSWSKETSDKEDYKPGNETIKLDKKLALGAYILSANGEGVNARELILVTDVSVVVKASGKNALVYFCNAIDGAPISKGKVKLWHYYYNGSKYIWQENTKETNQDGIAVFDLNKSIPYYNRNFFVSASIDDSNAFSTGYGYGYRGKEKEWRIYAFTDRPAYRPDEAVQFKCIARKYDGNIYSTPANETIELEITDSRGTKVKEGKLKLNSFGSAWGSLELTTTMPLGEYKINFLEQGKRQHIGNTVLFRLEEYKLPEFKVKVHTPEENEKKKTFKLGDKVEVTIKADYYFGGPVSNATVNVLVYQNPFYHTWQPSKEFPWYYENGTHGYYGEGQIIKREVLKTDVNGEAILIFDTSRHSNQDFEYRIEARVTDISRREIIGNSTVRVTRQRYYVYPIPEHNIYKPQDKVKINIKALDANDAPVQVEGMVKVTRDFWYEKEKFRGYKHEEIASRIIKTNKDGEAEVYFTPGTEGYYMATWNSKDKDGKQIKAETTVFVATKASNELGYKHGGLEIIIDKDTFSTGQKAVCLLSVPASSRYVLFSIEGEDLYSYQLVHITGTVKLIEISIEEKHVPNIFLNAVMVSDSQIFMDTEQVIIPPKEHFLNVKIESDKEKYQPGEEGVFTITTTDNNYKPVSSELALGLVDESVFYIQSDYAGDPRQFYYGTKRQHIIQTTSTFIYKSYKKRLKEKKELEDEQIGYRAGGEMIRGLKEVAVKDEISDIGNVRMKASISAPSALVSEKKEMLLDKQGILSGQEPAVVVRTDFRTTVFWQPDIETNKDGKAIVKVKFSDSLTTWKATTRVATNGNQFGIGDYTVKTSKPLIVRLQAPRFFVVGDTITISAVINNNTDENMDVMPYLTAEGMKITGEEFIKSTLQPIKIRPNGEARADWLVSVQKPGYAKLKVIAKSEKYSDAMEKKYIIYEHGIEKFISKSGKIKENDVTIKLNIPKERKIESTNLFVQITPSLAVTMLDALPYLIDYPYGCTEQTMNRFLPAVITAKTLKELGLHPEDINNKIFGGIEPEYVDKTHPEKKKDIYKLEEMVKQGLDRIYDFQHSDGGWGWWKEGETDHFMTSYVLFGLILANNSGIDVKKDVITRGMYYLNQEIVEEETNYDMQAWMLYVLSTTKQREISKFQQKAFENLWKNKDKLNAYTRSLFALSSYNFGYTEKAKNLIQNLENGVKIDKQSETAHWGTDGIYYRWSDSGVEATAFALRAILAIDPENKLIDQIVNWLIKGRRGVQWSNTRDTAITILALNDYLKESKELKSELEYELFVNGNFIVKKKITSKDILSAPSKFVIDSKFIKDGDNEIRIMKKIEDSPIYFSVNAKFFSLEEPIKQAGNEIFVNRKYYRLVAKPTLLKGYVYEKKLLSDKDEIKSGDRIETVITISAKNNYEYLVFEDLKPAGIETVQIRSGEQLYAKELKTNSDYTGRTKWVYQELRDRKVALFIDKLPEGIWEIRYEMRAEVPGSFHALPAIGYAMYVPEIRCNDTEIRIKVSDNQMQR